jgi:hypothetical protein
MTKTHFLTLLIVPMVCVVSTTLPAQSTKTNKGFLLDVNRPFVYVKFDHIGPGAPRSTDEPNSRIWLRLTNNCRIPILVRANGVPDESPKDEVGLEYEVVPNPTMRGMVSFSPSDKDRMGLSGETQKSETNVDDVPRGYMEEVASLVTIGPGEEVLFSMPINHLGKRWHVEIPFEFELPKPKGKGLRDPINGGIPVMVVQYSLWDLPPESQAETRKK